jgi:hypothetical protein
LLRFAEKYEEFERYFMANSQDFENFNFALILLALGQGALQPPTRGLPRQIR